MVEKVAAIELRQVSKRFGRRIALDNLSFALVHQPVTYARAYERRLHARKREAVTHRGHLRERTGERTCLASAHRDLRFRACRDLAEVRRDGRHSRQEVRFAAAATLSE